MVCVKDSQNNAEAKAASHVTLAAKRRGSKINQDSGTALLICLETSFKLFIFLSVPRALLLREFLNRYVAVT